MITFTAQGGIMMNHWLLGWNIFVHIHRETKRRVYIAPIPLRIHTKLQLSKGLRLFWLIVSKGHGSNEHTYLKQKSLSVVNLREYIF